MTEASFSGYLRKDGRVGLRNHLAIIPTVFCVNEVVSLGYHTTEGMEANAITIVVVEVIEDMDHSEACPWIAGIRTVKPVMVKRTIQFTFVISMGTPAVE